MRYRIKDPKKRAAVAELFGITESPELPQKMPVSAKALFFVVDCEYHDAASTFDVDIDMEPVPDNAPWKPFEPGTLKPFTRYFIVYRDTATGIIKEEARVTYEDGTFYGPEYEVLGWMEIPKWKE